ncbi:unnamed protein product [Mytilus edulis]|uniref:Fibrinogen C-terminal domain-containing protein n=1 Tax=Mytilus edulis TaxID=6550 RepID=A0A8S3VF40_MYTED|nr:unnamed protein product [Mytilus edulis]
MGTRVSGLMDTGLMGNWAYGHQGLWATGLMGNRAYGHQSLWTPYILGLPCTSNLPRECDDLLNSTTGCTLFILMMFTQFKCIVLWQTMRSGHGVESVRECTEVEVCGNDEVCFTHKYVTKTQEVSFDYGCTFHQFCLSGSSGSVFGKRRAGRHLVCQTCCNSTDICNIKSSCEPEDSCNTSSSNQTKAAYQRECDDLPYSSSGVYNIYPDGSTPVQVYCIMANNEKWTKITYQAITTPECFLPKTKTMTTMSKTVLKHIVKVDGGCANEEALAAKMLYLSKRVNTLKQRVEEENLERRKTIWKEPDNHTLDDFPVLDEEDLRNITCGVYQLKLSTSYIQEHLEGNCQILIHKEDEHLIRVKLQSRHVSSKTYILWIEYTSAEITAWYCKCRAGARVVGVCAHIASILWYLGYARHNQDISYGVQNWGAYLEGKSNLPRECDDLLNSTTGVYTIYPDGLNPIQVYCIMANNEKWTVNDYLTGYHNTYMFTTKDQQNDGFSSNCAVYEGGNGGWWYSTCAHVNLNGLYRAGPVQNRTAMFWINWPSSYYSLKKSTMMIKRFSKRP